MRSNSSFWSEVTLTQSLPKFFPVRIAHPLERNGVHCRREGGSTGFQDFVWRKTTSCNLLPTFHFRFSVHNHQLQEMILTHPFADYFASLLPESFAVSRCCLIIGWPTRKQLYPLLLALDSIRPGRKYNAIVLPVEPPASWLLRMPR